MFYNTRARFKNTIQKISEKDDEIGEMLKSHTRKGGAGRPRLETNQPELLATILDIGLFHLQSVQLCIQLGEPAKH